MIQLPRTVRSRWLMVVICLTGSIVMLAHFDRAAATPPPQVIASSITRTVTS